MGSGWMSWGKSLNTSVLGKDKPPKKTTRMGKEMDINVNLHTLIIKSWTCSMQEGRTIPAQRFISKKFDQHNTLHL